MSSTNKTTNLGLSQWQGHEYLQRDDLNNDHSIIDQTIGNTNDNDLLEELKGKSVVEMIKYLQEMVLEEDMELNISLNTQNPVMSTTSEVQNGQGVAVTVDGMFDINYAPDFNSSAWLLCGSPTLTTDEVTESGSAISFGPITTLGEGKQAIITGLTSNATMTVKAEVAIPDTRLRITDASNNNYLGEVDSDTTNGSKVISVPASGEILLQVVAETDVTLPLADISLAKVMLLDGDRSSEDTSYFKGVQPLRNIRLSCVGENLCDNVWEEGQLYSASGLNNDTTNTTRSVNFIDLEPETAYKFYEEGVTSGLLQLFMYDGEFNFLGYFGSTTQHITLAGTRYGRLVNTGEYNPDMKVSYVKGTTAPSEYKPYVESNSVIDGWWGDNDTLHIEGDGRVWEERSNEFVELNGNLTYSYRSNEAGLARINLLLSNLEDTSINHSGKFVTKTDGTILKATAGAYVADEFTVTDTEIVISIADMDSGWGESYTPTADEIKAYFNGWVMLEADAAIYESGTKYWAKRYQGIGAEVVTGFGASYESGTSTATLPATKAYGDITECYKLYYELAEPVQRDMTAEKGISTHSGEKCRFSVTSGIVEREEITGKFVWSDTYSKWYINMIGSASIPASTTDYKCSEIIQIVKSVDGVETVALEVNVLEASGTSSEVYGDYYLRIDSDSEFDKQARYFVTYEILHSEYDNQQVNASISYKQNVHDTIDNLNQRANRAETLVAQNMKQIGEWAMPTEWFYPTLLNGWTTNTGSSSPIRYGVNPFGLLVIVGDLVGGTNNTIAFVIPDGIRPAHHERIVAIKTNDSTIARVNVLNTGEVTVYAPTDTGTISIPFNFVYVGGN